MGDISDGKWRFVTWIESFSNLKIGRSSGARYFLTQFVFTQGFWEDIADEPGPYGEVEGGEDQGVVEGVPRSQGVKEPADQGKGGVGL